MTKTFEFTDSFIPDSSAVDGMYYADRTGELVVDLDDRIYTYNKVPYEFFVKARTVDSVGRDWLPVLKREYGPAEYNGMFSEVEFERVSSTRRTSDSVGTDKALTLNTGNSQGRHLSLVVPERAPFEPIEDQSESVVPDTTTWTVHFESAGVARMYKTQATNAVAAILALREVENMLDLTFKVTAVTQHFV